MLSSDSFLVFTCCLLLSIVKLSASLELQSKIVTTRQKLIRVKLSANLVLVQADLCALTYTTCCLPPAPQGQGGDIRPSKMMCASLHNIVVQRQARIF